MRTTSWENGIGVWIIPCGAIKHRVAAASAAEAEVWFMQRTGLAAFEYGDITQVEDLDRLEVYDERGFERDDRGRLVGGTITAREAIRRAQTFPMEL